MKKEKKQKVENQISRDRLNEVIKQRNELKEQLNELVTSIDKLEDENLVIKEQMLRALADYQNLVKSSEKRNEIRYFQLKKSLSESVIPSLDALNLAIKASKELKLDEKTKAWLDGILATIQSLEKSFSEIGIKQYLPIKGDKFDPTKHEAVATVEGGKSGEIYDLVQPGYILDNTVIKPARVVVSK
ncbi:MAG TPA: nucleotide exchange factor GrpE [Candidatus Dojkabacteria bacterium]|nr:nucleotide exchange factor GrpE [Candidatus Dojkabacteria bacterium]HOT60703.1 nucleotide exchange factor GrpE [Candidatus Dojkabacteria bacterium]HQI92416.1 nucleotide exchange factor GrpE [Candidatus Dojkabacteria bacterium]